MKALKLAALTALLATLSVAHSFADQTNLVQNLQIQLLGVSQGGTWSNSNVTVTSANFTGVDTRRVIAALGAATGNSFGRGSALVLVTPLDGSPVLVQVRDGATSVDVTGFFVKEQLSDSVESSVHTRRNGRSFATVYNIQRLALQDSAGYPALNLHFDVRGFAVQNSAGQGSYLTINASGSGDRNGNLLILQGNINVRGGTIEVVPSGGGNGDSPNV
jgi:hypothetical protein